MKIQILVDNPRSWILPHALELSKTLERMGYSSKVLSSHSEIETGEILILLGCEKKLKDLSLNKHNLVVHESDLPKGKGWSPMTWQVLEGESQIPITLFEAVDELDGGAYYYKDSIFLEGHEFVEEIRLAQGVKTIELVMKFILNYPDVIPIEKNGEATYYQRRGPEDSILDLDKSIREQINLLRVVDNERYPAFFYFKDRKITIKVVPE